MAPGIEQFVGILEVGTVPRRRRGGRFRECRQPLVITRIVADIEVVELQGVLEILDLDLRRLDLCGRQIVRTPGATTAATRPIMPSTTSSSTSVNPAAGSWA
jgi:hypothetical protein